MRNDGCERVVEVTKKWTTKEIVREKKSSFILDIDKLDQPVDLSQS